MIRGLVASPRCQLAALCSRDPRQAQQAAAAIGSGVRVFTSATEMVRSGAVEAVFVNTPIPTHYELCLAAIRAGCAVICEKPLAADTRQAIELRGAAAAAGVRTAVNFTYRSVAGYRLTERWLSEEGIGRPLHAEFALLQGHNFLAGFPRASALLDSGVHLFDALLGLSERAGLGPVAEVCAAAFRDGEGPDVGWGFTARTAAGAVISGLFTRSAMGWRNGLRWGLYGTEAAIVVELDAERTEARFARRGDGRDQGTWRPVALPEDLRADEVRFPEYHLDRLVGAVRGEEPFPDFAAAEATHHLADALAASAATGRWVAVDRQGEAGGTPSRSRPRSRRARPLRVSASTSSLGAGA